MFWTKKQYKENKSKSKDTTTRPFSTSKMCIWDQKTSKISQKNTNTFCRQRGLKLGQFNTKVESLTLAWIKRLKNSTSANWKVLPKHNFNCTNLDLFFCKP